jgi:hypothetical protein
MTLFLSLVYNLVVTVTVLYPGMFIDIDNVYDINYCSYNSISQVPFVSDFRTTFTWMLKAAVTLTTELSCATFARRVRTLASPASLARPTFARAAEDLTTNCANQAR